MHLVGYVVDGHALEEVFFDGGGTHRCQQRRNHVLVRADVIDDRSRLDDTGPANEARHAIAAFPLRVLLAAENRRPAIGPAHGFRAVVT